MKKEKAAAAPQEQRCPACNHRFTVDPAVGAKNVRCPRCREIVVAAPESVGALPASPGPDWKTQMRDLETRLEALERQVALHVAAIRSDRLLISRLAARERSAQDSEIAQRLGAENSGHERGPPVTGTPRVHSGFSDAPREERSSAPYGITLLASAEHVANRKLITQLTELLTREDWRVQEIKATAVPTSAAAGLTLIAAPRLPRERLTETFNALRTVGLALSLQLDPNLGAREAILILGPSSTSDTPEAG